MNAKANYQRALNALKQAEANLHSLPSVCDTNVLTCVRGEYLNAKADARSARLIWVTEQKNTASRVLT